MPEIKFLREIGIIALIAVWFARNFIKNKHIKNRDWDYALSYFLIFAAFASVIILLIQIMPEW